MHSYERAKTLIIEHGYSGLWTGQTLLSVVMQAEHELDLVFPADYKQFLLDFGAGSFGSAEFYGIIRNDLTIDSFLNVVWLVKNDRARYKLPVNLVIIGAAGNGSYYVLNAPKNSIHYFMPNVPIEEQPFDLVNDSFGDFILEEIENVLNNPMYVTDA